MIQPGEKVQTKEINLDESENSKRNSVSVNEEELESLKAHYTDLVKSKNERLEKQQEKIRALEKENETLQTEHTNIKEQNERIIKEITVSENKRIENEAICESKIKNYEDLINSYKQWSEFDLSKYTAQDQIDLDRIKQRLHYDSVQIKIHEENIKSLEMHIKVLEVVNKPLASSEAGYFDYWLGKTPLKMECQKLASENKMLKEKEDSVTKLIKVHKLETENQDKQIAALKEQLHKGYETNAPNNTIQDLKESLQKKEDAIKEMKLRIDTLNQRINEEKQKNDNLTEENKETKNMLEHSTKQMHTLNEKKSALDLEYEQLEFKYKNATSEIERLQMANETLREGIIEYKTSKKLATSPSGSTSPLISQKIVFQSAAITEEGIFHPSQNPRDVSTDFKQVNERDDDNEPCPNCQKLLPRQDLDKHIDLCLEEYC